MTKSERKRLCDTCRARFPVKTPSLFAKQLKAQRKEKQEQERLTKKGARAAVRAACVTRANGYCECGCGLTFLEFELARWPELDHFYGRARAESVETCWMLTAFCHREKTENAPSRRYWTALWEAHCTRYGYPFTPRFGGRPKADARNEPSNALSGAISSAQEPR